jgi:hypothetical protein
MSTPKKSADLHYCHVLSPVMQPAKLILVSWFRSFQLFEEKTAAHLTNTNMSVSSSAEHDQSSMRRQGPRVPHTLAFHCNICNIFLNSQAQLASHREGARHLREMAVRGAMPHPRSPSPRPRSPSSKRRLSPSPHENPTIKRAHTSVRHTTLVDAVNSLRSLVSLLCSSTLVDETIERMCWNGDERDPCGK